MAAVQQFASRCRRRPFLSSPMNVQHLASQQQQQQANTDRKARNRAYRYICTHMYPRFEETGIETREIYTSPLRDAALGRRAAPAAATIHLILCFFAQMILLLNDWLTDWHVDFENRGTTAATRPPHSRRRHRRLKVENEASTYVDRPHHVPLRLAKRNTNTKIKRMQGRSFKRRNKKKRKYFMEHIESLKPTNQAVNVALEGFQNRGLAKAACLPCLAWDEKHR
ncbi:hypothetical protein FN846DRAFT_892604 [Sphaerosporella brunnea]|uniref:Uncharacterized protein n=1 Tax=Sphaerosporella brunnea TaxID=1250544 RepID=A0A5J5ENI9_9PEZI|nr:hypothetical protein FN846DRAFT_892604 [Sphaerosporella brunnea]